MGMREKLIEILRGVIKFHEEQKEKWILGGKVGERPSITESFVDILIANGVTMREESGCEYCLEDQDGYRRGFGAFSLHNPFHASVWEISTGHCKPRQIYFCPMCGRKLTEPPSNKKMIGIVRPTDFCSFGERETK